MDVQAHYPKFHNAVGAAIVSIGCREFACIGDIPPQDHPHVYLNMVGADEIVCPYCATIFRFDPSLAPFDARPAECAFRDVDFENSVRQTTSESYSPLFGLPSVLARKSDGGAAVVGDKALRAVRARFSLNEA
jgi:uncharacterized Zn-finger protein